MTESFGASCPTPYQLLEDGDPTATAALCENLHQYGYAIVRFSPAAEAEVAALRTGAADFFGLATADKAAIGDFRFVGDTYAGYRDSIACDAEFLEMHTDSTGGTYPALAKPLGLSAAVAALHTRLDGMSRRILSILAAHIGVAEEALLSPLDPPTSAPTDATEQDVSRGGNDDRADLSASVLRVCHYRRRPGAVGAEADAGPAQADAADAELEVLFDAHTDSFSDEWKPHLALSEQLNGKPFERRYAMGFSNGGYFASFLALEGLWAMDGAALSAAGRSFIDEANLAGIKPPIFIAVGAQDTDTTVASAQTLAKVLKTQGWPHRLVIDPERGHELRHNDLLRAAELWEKE